MSGELAEAVVDLAAIAANVRTIAAVAGTGLMAVVKADGFGHGAVPVARAALAAGAGWLGVDLDRRGAGPALGGHHAHRSLSWLHRPDEDFARLIGADVDIAVSSLAHLHAVAEAAGRLGAPAAVQLKADTGLSRNGATADDWPELVAWARKYEAEGEPAGARRLVAPGRRRRAGPPARRPPGRDLPGRPADRPRRRARPRTGAPGQLGGGADRPADPVRPLPDRARALRRRPVRGGRPRPVRPAPRDDAAVDRGQRQAGAGRHRGLLRAGPRDRPADHPRPACRSGTPTACPGPPRVGPSVWLAGRRCPVVGRIAMDQCVVDAGDLPVALGDPVTVFGPGPSAPARRVPAPGPTRPARPSRPSPSGPGGRAQTHTRC